VDRDDPSALRSLTRLFLLRLLDNDLISPAADRHESFAVMVSSVLSLALVVTFLISTEYLAAFIQLPGQTSLSALSDRFLFFSASMLVCGLAALMVWDALDLEPRDAAILGPLPISSGTITRAKLVAVLVFGTALAIALNAVPSVLYPTFLTLNLRGMGGGGVVHLIAGHAAAVTAAGLFGFFAILALRGLFRLTLGQQGFRTSSSAFQSALMVCAVAALLLAPTVRAKRVSDWVAGHGAAPAPAVLPLWYLGLNETLAGHIVAETPMVMPPRLTLAEFLRKEDDAGRATYRGLRPQFAVLARAGVGSALVVVVLGIVCFLWNNRRLPDRSAAAPRPFRVRAVTYMVSERLTRSDPEAQAGFFFGMQTLTRSAPHRTIAAISLAIGLTLPIVTVTSTGLHHIDVAEAPLGVLAIHVMVLVALLTGFRHAVAVPAELGSNWIMRMAWLGDERRYLVGVKRAGLLTFVVVPSLLMLPLHIRVWGLGKGVMLTMFGILFATAIEDGLFIAYRKMPFACSYLPPENPKLLWPIAVAAFLLVSYGFAYGARAALETPIHSALFGVLLCAIVLTAKMIDWANRRTRFPVYFDEEPAPTTQRLGLLEQLAVHK